MLSVNLLTFGTGHDAVVIQIHRVEMGEHGLLELLARHRFGAGKCSFKELQRGAANARCHVLTRRRMLKHE